MYVYDLRIDGWVYMAYESATYRPTCMGTLLGDKRPSTNDDGATDNYNLVFAIYDYCHHAITNAHHL